MEIKKEVFGFDIKGQRSINTPNDFSIGTDEEQVIIMKLGDIYFNEKGEILLSGAPDPTVKFWYDKKGSHLRVGEQVYGDGVGGILNYNKKADFPKPGTPGVIYKSQSERRLYQWNENITDYELLGDPGDIEIKMINGGQSTDE